MKDKYKVYEGYFELFVSTKILDLTLVNEFDTMAEAEEFCENSDYWMWIDSDLVDESQYSLVGDDYDLHVFNAKEYETIH